MKPQEIVEALKTRNPKVFANIQDARAANIVRQVLLQLGEEVDRVSEEQPLRLPGLGVFRMKKTAPTLEEKNRFAFVRVTRQKAVES